MAQGIPLHFQLVALLTGSFQQMTLREAQLLTLNVLKQVMEEKLDQHNVQLAQVCLLSVIRFCAIRFDR
jgi:hypothetical protein